MAIVIEMDGRTDWRLRVGNAPPRAAIIGSCCGGPIVPQLTADDSLPEFRQTVTAYSGITRLPIYKAVIVPDAAAGADQC